MKNIIDDMFILLMNKKKVYNWGTLVITGDYTRASDSK